MLRPQRCVVWARLYPAVARAHCPGHITKGEVRGDEGAIRVGDIRWPKWAARCATATTDPKRRLPFLHRRGVLAVRQGMLRRLVAQVGILWVGLDRRRKHR